MKPLKIFISSVQQEFERERKDLSTYIREDALLSSFFDVFLVEELADSRIYVSSAQLEQVAKSDIYIGILGIDYDFVNKNTISSTEQEYIEAKNQMLQQWVFIKTVNDENRNPKELDFIKKVKEDLVPKHFASFNELKLEVYKCCIHSLKLSGKIITQQFDESLHPGANFEDIDDKKITSFINVAFQKRNLNVPATDKVAETLSHLDLSSNHQIANVALIAFGKNPQHFFRSATIRCASFHREVVEYPIPEAIQIGGTVFEIIENSIDFIMSKLKIFSRKLEMGHELNTTYEIPRIVIAEAITNAVAHRDYYSNASIQVSIFSNRVEVFNPVRLPNELIRASLQNPDCANPLNPQLANLLFLNANMNLLGTGIKNMIKYSEEARLMPPEFIINNGFKVVLWRTIDYKKKVHKSKLKVGLEIMNFEVHDGAHDVNIKRVHEIVHVSGINYLENTSHRLVRLLDSEMSREELMHLLGLKSRNNFQKTYIKPCTEEGLIQQTLLEKKTSKNQKYKLTKKGRLLQKKLK